MHTRTRQRAARAVWFGGCTVAAIFLLMAPLAHVRMLPARRAGFQLLPLPTIGAARAFAQTTAAPGGFGYGYQVQMWDFNPTAQQTVVGEVQESGFNWLTHQIDWSAVETAPGQYDFSQTDAIVNDANQAGLSVMLSVAHAPAFYQTPTSGRMPGDPSTFGTFMQALATQYAGKVQAYELWNEENLDRETGPGNVDPSTYLPLLEAGYNGVKAGDPNALVLLGAPSTTGADVPGSIMDDITYLQNLYAINNGEVSGYFDVLSAHPSGYSNPPDCTPDTPQCSLSGGWNDDPSFFAFTRASQYEDIMAANGDGGKQIWFTEYGYCSNPFPPQGYEYCKYITEQQQAQFLMQAMQMARQTPYVGAMFVWNLNFQVAVPQSDEKWGFAVTRADWSPRPAYGALLGMPKP